MRETNHRRRQQPRASLHKDRAGTNLPPPTTLAMAVEQPAKPTLTDGNAALLALTPRAASPAARAGASSTTTDRAGRGAETSGNEGSENGA